MGAGELLPWSTGAELYALSAARGGPVAVLATASAPEGDGVFERWAEMALAHYRSLGVPARVLEVKTRQHASSCRSHRRHRRGQHDLLLGRRTRYTWPAPWR